MYKEWALYHFYDESNLIPHLREWLHVCVIAGFACRSPHVPLIPTSFPHGQPLWPPRSHQPSTHFYPGQPPFEGWVINVPSDTPSGHSGSPGGQTHTHLTHTANLHTCTLTRTGDPSNSVNWPSVAVSCVLVYDGDPEVSPKRPSCAIMTIPSSTICNWMHHKTNPKDMMSEWRSLTMTLKG